jgi:hypothetical protein
MDVQPQPGRKARKARKAYKDRKATAFLLRVAQKV